MIGNEGQSAVSSPHQGAGPELELKLDGIPWGWIILGAVLAAAAAIMITYLIKNSGRIKASSHKLSLETEELDERKAGRKRRRKRSATNADRTRELYCEYLAFLRAKGVRIERNDTTEDISGEAEGLAGDDGPLREAYRIARYGDRAVTDGEYEAAKNWYYEMLAAEGRAGGEGA